ncbi:hypothetical protein MHYP_G00191170 [Metynnis hypsauchen]
MFVTCFSEPSEVQRLQAASPRVEPSILCELYAGFTTQPYRHQPESPRLFVELLVLQFHGGLQCSFWTLWFSYTQWRNRDNQRIFVREHYVLRLVLVDSHQ